MPTVVASPYPFPEKYLFYRINVTANDGQASTESREVRLREFPGGANLMPTFLAAASGSGGTPANLFDDNTGTIWTVSGSSGIAQAELTEPKTVREYTVVGTGSQGGRRNFNTWTFEASSDGINWIILDSQSGQTGWADLQERVFTL